MGSLGNACDALPRGHSCLTAVNGVQWFTGCYSLELLEALHALPHRVPSPLLHCAAVDTFSGLQMQVIGHLCCRMHVED